MEICVSADVGTWTNWLTFEPDPDHSPDPGADLHRIFDISSYGQISMNFNGSIATGAWTSWLRFELDPDHSPDPGAGFTLDFGILAGCLKKIWQISMKLYGSMVTGAWTIWLGFDPYPIIVQIQERIYTWFLILAGYLKKLWTDYASIAAGVCKIWTDFD